MNLPKLLPELLFSMSLEQKLFALYPFKGVISAKHTNLKQIFQLQPPFAGRSDKVQHTGILTCTIFFKKEHKSEVSHCFNLISIAVICPKACLNWLDLGDNFVEDSGRRYFSSWGETQYHIRELISLVTRSGTRNLKMESCIDYLCNLKLIPNLTAYNTPTFPHLNKNKHMIVSPRNFHKNI